MSEKKCAPCRPNSVGGQAVIEGVMMKNGTRVALAIRKEDGSVEVKNSEFHPLKEKHKWINIPILRGIVGFVESMILSFRTLGDSTEMLGIDELEEKEKAEKAEKKAKRKLEKQAKKQGVTVEELQKSAEDNDTENIEKSEEVSKKAEKKDNGSASTGFIMAISLVLGLVLAIALFMFLPTYATDGINYLVTKYTNLDGINHYVQASIEGVIRILIFIIYIASVSLMKDIKRTFSYHGAEHKSIACYESGMELTPENARKCSRFHPRCGTSFLFVMIIISIVVGIFIPEFEGMSWLRSVCKVACLPLIMGIGYEFIMLAGKHNNWLTRALSAPGLWMQRLTTKEPDDKQLAIAICAIKATMPEEFPNFDPSEYAISREENKDHIMYEESK
ncbi:MAG: DUF1385 domain-containing protein [Clostridia bacterium]|nr:DUF1385 domain-containing protein [Clostridia bacterium]